MKRRTEIILRDILKNKKDLNLIKISKKFSVSERTIENDIIEINNFLGSLGQEYIYFDSDGQLCSVRRMDRKRIISSLKNYDIKNYKFSKEERMTFIYVILIWVCGYNNMEHIAKMLNVTRITILNDIKDLKDNIDSDINILTYPGKGLKLKIDNHKRIDELNRIFEEISLIKEKSIFNDYLIKTLDFKLNFNDILVEVRDYFYKKNIIISENYLFYISLFIFISLNINNKFSDSCSIDDKDSVIYYVAEKLNVELSNNDINNFEIFIKEKGINTFKKEIDELELFGVVNHFLVNIDKKINSKLSLDNVLVESLVMHIKNMRDWGNVDIELPEISKTIIDYDKIEKEIKNNIYILEAYLSYKLSKNMINSLIIHICISFIRTNQEENRIRTIIVCPGSMATGRLLELQIEKYFKFDIIDVTTVEEIFECRNKLKDADFIISTIDIDEITSNYIKVNPILSMNDMNRLQDLAIRRSYNKNLRNNYNSKIDYISNNNSNRNVLSNILVNPVEIIRNKISWEDAMVKAAKPLLDYKFIKKSYVEKSIENIKTYGDYIIIGYGVAIAHAGKNEGVYKDCLNLLISRDGIQFSENNKVYLLFFFASKGEHDYRKLYETLIKIGRDKNFVNELRNMDSKAAYEALVKY